MNCCRNGLVAGQIEVLEVASVGSLGVLASRMGPSWTPFDSDVFSLVCLVSVFEDRSSLDVRSNLEKSLRC